MIPASELHISGPEWTTATLQNVADCDRAIVALAEIIGKIEADLTSPRAAADPEWAVRAQKVLSMRKSARMHVYVLRKGFKIEFNSTWEKDLLQVIKQLDPALFYRAVSIAKGTEKIAA
jgi:hypothetical protein